MGGHVGQLGGVGAQLASTSPELTNTVLVLGNRHPAGNWSHYEKIDVKYIETVDVTCGSICRDHRRTGSQGRRRRRRRSKSGEQLGGLCFDACNRQIKR